MSELDLLGAFIGFMALYGYTDREFAAELTVDVATLTALNASNLSGEKGGADIIVFVIPMIFHTRLSSDPCEVIGQISGTAISEHTSAPSPRVLIVASKTNPYDAARKSSWKVASQRRADNREEECSFVFSAYLP